MVIGRPLAVPSVHKTPWGNMSSTHTSNIKMAKLVCGRHLVSFCGHRASPRSFQVSTKHLGETYMSSTHTSNKKMAKLVCGRHLVSFCGHRASPRSSKCPQNALGKHVLHPHLQQKDGEACLRHRRSKRYGRSGFGRTTFWP